jgi:hypothetical protein
VWTFVTTCAIMYCNTSLAAESENHQSATRFVMLRSVDSNGLENIMFL